MHLLNDNRDRVTGFYWSSKCDVSLLVHTFRKQTWPNICEHNFYDTNRVAVITMDKYLIMKKTEKDSDHNEHH
jgi:hypothetical protein